MVFNKQMFSTVDEAVTRGTDLQFEGEFVETLSFNHFTKEDMGNLKGLSGRLQALKPECVKLLSLLLDKLPTRAQTKLTSADIESYVGAFLFADRNQDYVDTIMPFFKKLGDCGYNTSQVVVSFNRFHLFIMNDLLSKATWGKYAGLKSFQKAATIEIQLLVEVCNEQLMEQLAHGISGLMDKNAEIMFIKDLMEKVSLQTNSSQNVMAATEQMTASITEVANNSTQVAEKAQETMQKTNQGKVTILSALNSMIGTEHLFSQMVTNFNQLESKIKNIQNMTHLIKEIADQTHLLSLNASIEAARAGEHGAGFDVISREIRKLADHTAHALVEVEQNVGEFRKITNELSESIVSTSDTIQENLHKAKDAMPIMDDIVDQIKTVNEATNSIASISKEQAIAIDEVANRTVEITDLSEQVNQLTTHTGEAVYNLSKMMDAFRSSVFANNIKLTTKSLLWLAKTDHILWKWRVYNMLIGFEKIDPQKIASHKDCRLGKWYFDPEEQKLFGHLEIYTGLDEPHQEVHHYAKLAAEAIHHGDQQEAERCLTMLEAASHNVVDRINQLLEMV